MNRTTLLLAALAMAIVAIATPFQLFDIPLAPLAALIIGAGAGWWVSAFRARENNVSAITAGLVVGGGALIGSILGLAVLALFVGNLPEVQAYVQNSEPHPEARIPSEWVAPLGALAGVAIGLALGLFDLLLSAVGGWVAGLIYTRNHPAGI